MKYKVIKSKRKSICLSLNEKGEPIVKAPIKVSDKVIEDFVLSKQKWLEKQLKAHAKIDDFSSKFDFKNKIYLLGQELKLEEVDMSLLALQENKLERKLSSLYLEYAHKILPQMVKEVLAEHNLRCASLKVSSSHRIWGSFDRNLNMKLNWKLVHLPKPLINYVIIHELCHGLQLNHSPKFWQQVSIRCPEYKQLKKQLEMYSFLLK